MKIIFCLPGRQFSDLWVQSWNDTLMTMSKAGHTWAYSMAYDPVVYFARNRVLGGSNIAGKNQPPFQGKAAYDYMVWIDSDMVWKGQDILNLIKMNKPVASACYLMQNGTHYPLVEKLDFNKLATDGTFSFMSKVDILGKTHPVTVSYAGFGLLVVQHGVFESMEYPWFRPRWVHHDNFTDFTSEDVSFCWTAQENGFDIWVDPNIQVGHEKMVVLR